MMKKIGCHMQMQVLELLIIHFGTNPVKRQRSSKNLNGMVKTSSWILARKRFQQLPVQQVSNIWYGLELVITVLEESVGKRDSAKQFSNLELRLEHQ